MPKSKRAKTQPVRVSKRQKSLGAARVLLVRPDGDLLCVEETAKSYQYAARRGNGLPRPVSKPRPALSPCPLPRFSLCILVCLFLISCSFPTVERGAMKGVSGLVRFHWAYGPPVIGAISQDPDWAKKYYLLIFPDLLSMRAWARAIQEVAFLRLRQQ